jgi:hypothetical protein
MAQDDLIIVRGLNEPKVPLLVQSETTLMSTATPTGFEFVSDPQGRVTHVLIRDGGDVRKAVRKAGPVR